MLRREYDIDPAEELARLLVTSDDPEFRRQCAKDLLPYCYPTLKSVEVTGTDGEAFEMTLRIVPHADAPPPPSDASD
jgi:hypothetical protein